MNNANKKNISDFVLLALFWVGFSAPSWAADFKSARATSLGGAGHAAPLLNDSVFQNPSTMSFLPSYSVAYNYFFVKNAQPPATGEKARGYSASIQDGRSELFQGAAAYTLREDTKLIHAAISRRLGGTLAAGIGAKFFFDSPNLPTGKNMSVATTWAPTENLQIAAIADNLFETAASHAHDDYRQFTLGTKINLRSILFLYLDPNYAPDQPAGRYGYESGVELAAFQDLLFRGGVFRNSETPSVARRGRGWAVGASWIGPRITLDYAMEKLIVPHEQNAHVLGATIYF